MTDTSRHVAPVSVMVVGQVFAVEYAKAADIEDNLGKCDVRQQWIKVATDQAPDQMRDSLLHETLHACIKVAGVPIANADEEDVCRVLAPVLLDCIRRSPGLAEWLLDGR